MSETRCLEPVLPSGVERVAAGPCLVLTRAGLFRRHMGRRTQTPLLVDSATALLFNDGDPYRVSSPTGSAHDCTVLAFSPAVAAEVAASLDPAASDRLERPFTVGDAVLPAHAIYRHHRFSAALRRGITGELGAPEEALCLLHEVVAAGLRPRGIQGRRRSSRTRRAHRDLANEVRALLAQAPSAAHPLIDIAAALDSSPFHVARVFRHETGMPIHRYLLQLRLALALEHLADDRSSVGVLALDLGFYSHSHFTALFRRTYGVAPEAARRLLVGTRCVGSGGARWHRTDGPDRRRSRYPSALPSRRHSRSPFGQDSDRARTRDTVSLRMTSTYFRK